MPSKNDLKLHLLPVPMSLPLNHLRYFKLFWSFISLSLCISLFLLRHPCLYRSGFDCSWKQEMKQRFSFQNQFHQSTTCWNDMIHAYIKNLWEYWRVEHCTVLKWGSVIWLFGKKKIMRLRKFGGWLGNKSADFW